MVRCCWPCCYCQSYQSCCSYLSPSPSPYSCLCCHCWGWGQEGVGPPEDTMVPTVVAAGVAANAEDVLLLMAGS
jgi:hypothetical protein